MSDEEVAVDVLEEDVVFAIVPEWVLDAEISDRAVRLYAVLCRYAGDKGHAWPGREALASRLRCSKESIDRAVRELKTLGAVTVKRRTLPDGQPTSNLYTVKRIPPSSVVTKVVVTGDDKGPRVGDDKVPAPVTTERESGNEKQGNEIVASAPTTKATRIPDPFILTPQQWAWACEENNLSRDFVRAETLKFVDYWRAEAGARARKVDWPATWRNWIRRASERGTQHRPGGFAPRPDVASRNAEHAAEALRIVGER